MTFLAFALKYWQEIAGVIVISLLTILYQVHVDGLIKVAVDKAVIERDTQWRASEAKAIAQAKAAAAIDFDKREQDLKSIINQQAKDANDAKTQHDKDVAAARSGALKLRFATTIGGCPALPSGDGASVSGSVTNPTTQSAELSPEATSALYSIADDADALVADDNACWAIVASDHKPFTGASP